MFLTPITTTYFTEEEEERSNKDSLTFNTLSIIYNKAPDKYIKSLQHFD